MINGSETRPRGSVDARNILDDAVIFNASRVQANIPAGAGDGIDLNLDWSKVQMTVELREMLDMLDSEGDEGIYQKYAGYINGIEYIWVPTFALDVTQVGGWFWYAMKKVAEMGNCSCTITGPGVDGIGQFLGMSRSSFENDGWEWEEVSIETATSVAILYTEKSFDGEPEECCDKTKDACEKDFCWDPLLSHPSALEIIHEPLGEFRGHAETELYIKGGSGPDGECSSQEYPYACRDFDLEHELNGSPIFNFYDYNDEGGDSGEKGDYCHKGYIPIFGNTQPDPSSQGLGEMACGHTFMSAGRIRESRNHPELNADTINVGSPNNDCWGGGPLMLLNTDSSHEFITETHGTVCHPTGYKDIECQCSEDYIGTINSNYSVSPLTNPFYCPGDYTDLEKFEKSTTQTYKIESVKPPDSNKYKFIVQRDTDEYLDSLSFESNAYTLESMDQGGPEYDKEYILDTCSDNPIEGMVSAMINGGEYIDYSASCTGSGIFAPEDHGPGPESSRATLTFKFTKFNRGFLIYSMAGQAASPIDTVVDSNDKCLCPGDGGFEDEGGGGYGYGDDCEDKNMKIDDFTWYRREEEISINGEVIQLTSQKKKECDMHDWSSIEDFPTDASCYATCDSHSLKNVETYSVYIPISLNDKDGGGVPEYDHNLSAPYFYYKVEGYAQDGYFFDNGANHPLVALGPGSITFNAGECIAFTKKTTIKTYDPQKREDGGAYPEENVTTETLYLEIPKELNAYDIRKTVTQEDLDLGLICCSPTGSNVSRSWVSEDILFALDSDGGKIGQADDFVSLTLGGSSTPCSGGC